MAIREKSTAKRHDEAIFNETRREVTLLAILAVLIVFLFPALQGPYSIVHGSATTFRATRSARIAYESIVQGALHLIREPVASRAISCGPIKPLEDGSPLKRDAGLQYESSLLIFIRYSLQNPSQRWHAVCLSIVAMRGTATQ